MSNIVRRAVGRLCTSQRFLDGLAELIAVELVRELRTEYGGDYIYITKTTSLREKEERNAMLRSLFTGNNYPEVSKLSGLSTRQVRLICANTKTRLDGNG